MSFLSRGTVALAALILSLFAGTAVAFADTSVSATADATPVPGVSIDLCLLLNAHPAATFDMLSKLIDGAPAADQQLILSTLNSAIKFEDAQAKCASDVDTETVEPSTSAPVSSSTVTTTTTDQVAEVPSGAPETGGGPGDSGAGVLWTFGGLVVLGAFLSLIATRVARQRQR